MASDKVSRSEQRLNEVLAAFLEAVEAGQQPNQQDWLQRYPDVAGELAEFFANREQLASLGEPCHAAAQDQGGRTTLAVPRPRSSEPALFGDYLLLAEIARGGMGIVYKARQVSLKRLVALKMILNGELAGRAAVRRFRSEAEAAASLDHPNIVPIYEVGERDGQHYFSMKLIEGGSLRDQTARFHSDQRAAARLLARVCRAVHHAHQRGILHRDLKPANILLDRQGEPHVTDFGLAKRVRPDGWASQSQQIVGTASYMPPEQAMTRGTALTVAADVYSLGAVLYDLLTGRPPFKGDNPLDTLIRVVEEQPVPPRQLNPTIDADLESICLKCLAKAPEQRYPSAAALAEDLENWAAGGPVSVRTAGRAERLGRWCRRNPVVAALVFSIAGLLGAGGAYSAVLNLQLTAAAEELATARDDAVHNAQQAEANALQARTNAATAAQTAERERQTRAAADKVRDEALAALRREQLALQEEQVQREQNRQLLVRQYVASGTTLLDGGDPLGALSWFGEALRLEGGNPERERPHRIRLATTLRRCPHTTQVVFHDGALGPFCLSGDGRHLFTAERDGPARLWNTAANKASTLRLSSGERVLHAAFSPDSRLLATAGESGQVRFWDASSGEALGQPLRHAGPVTQVEFSSDSQRLLTASRDGTARVWQAAGGKPLSVPLPHGAPVTFAAFSPDGRKVVTTGTAAGEARPEARIWDWASGQQLGKPLRHQQSVVQATFSADGLRLFTSANLHNLRGWDLATHKPLALSWANGRGSYGPWFSPDAQRVLLAQGTTARVFDLNTGQPLGQPLPHGGDILLGAFSPDGRQVVTAGWDRVVRVWDTLSGQPLTPPLRHPRRVVGVAFDRAGQALVTGSEDATVRLWDIRSHEQAAPPLQLNSSGEVLAVGPGGRQLLLVKKSVPRVWDVAGAASLTAPLPVSGVTQAAFSPDGQRLLTLDAEALRVWDLAAVKPEGRVLEPRGRVQWLTFNADGSRVVARLPGDQVRVWDAATSAEVASGKPPGNSPWDLPVVSPNGRRIVVLRFKQAVQVWDMVANRAVLPLLKHTAAPLHAAYGPDGRRLATACADGTVHLWDANTGEPLTPPLVHGRHLRLVGFSRDGRQLVTVGSDRTARVWDAVTGQPLTPLWQQAESAVAATFSPDSNRLATVSKGGTVRVWDLRADNRPTADLVQLTRLLSGQQMHAASGSLVPFEPGDLRLAWPQLRARYPAEFGGE